MQVPFFFNISGTIPGTACYLLCKILEHHDTTCRLLFFCRSHTGGEGTGYYQPDDNDEIIYILLNIILIIGIKRPRFGASED